MATHERRIGVDVGGTFTDVVTIRDGTISVTKTASTPTAPDEGVVDGLERAARGREETEDGPSLSDVAFFAHGTTVATNAVLERAWAETALVTTAGFRDVLEIGRQTRPDLYDFQADKPVPIVERDRRFEVPERLDERGGVLTPLDEERVADVAREIAATDAESVAISLLFSFENDDHERRVETLLAEGGVNVPISRSSVVLPEVREYERTLATALNAALKPVMDTYIGRLEGRLCDLDVPAALRIMQSNGGLIRAKRAREAPINTLLSGPAAGVQGATHVAGLCGIEDLLTMDMGGTSCDVSLVSGGEPAVSTEVAVGDYPVGVPMIDVHTIGAGGGSIAWIDAGGALRVGPRSAGADPGPICYGRGGMAPTVTDAHLLLGRLDPGAFLPDLDADVELVREQFRDALCEPLDLSVEDAAQGVLDVANANMERALRVVSVERGHDPREFALVAFGGAGPLHAPELAAALDIPRVVVPRTAGVLSALGLLITDLVYDFSTSRVRRFADVSPADLESIFGNFEREGAARLHAEGIDEERQLFERRLDLRYVGQSFELDVPAPDDLDEAAVDRLANAFHERHERRYGHSSPDEPVELVTVRLRARGLVESPDLVADDRSGSVADAIREERSVVFGGVSHETPAYERDRLPTDASFDGPAIVEGAESTVVLPPGQRARVDGYGNLLVEVAP